MNHKYLVGAALLLVVITFVAKLICNKSSGDSSTVLPLSEISPVQGSTSEPPEKPILGIPVTRQVAIEHYFQYMDDLVRAYDTLVPYELSEQFLVRANPWLIDRLENTDYYRQIALGNFVVDQRKMTILQAGDTLFLPGPKAASILQTDIQATYLDINLPAFRLHIIQRDSVLYDFPVRIGKNQKKYLAMAKGYVDLRTHTGTGEIIRINRSPVFYDPVTGKQFTHTKRDDHNTTWMPLIPWIEPSINGNRYGQMIHPTTNPRTLGKPASNGCIGLKEADAWRVYYYAPLGTKVVIRYDLLEVSPNGDTLRYNDVYQYQTGRKKTVGKSALLPSAGSEQVCWCGQ
ncbi:MAG: L,D-transpeptidase [Saprospiraceae bacterium]|nr:L,D-transpeptidase [Saprospiraceae bacterium]